MKWRFNANYAPTTSFRIADCLLGTAEREKVQRQEFGSLLCYGLQRLVLCSPNQKPQDSRGFAQR